MNSGTVTFLLVGCYLECRICAYRLFDAWDVSVCVWLWSCDSYQQLKTLFCGLLFLVGGACALFGLYICFGLLPLCRSLLPLNWGLIYYCGRGFKCNLPVKKKKRENIYKLQPNMQQQRVMLHHVKNLTLKIIYWLQTPESKYQILIIQKWKPSCPDTVQMNFGLKQINKYKK